MAKISEILEIEKNREDAAQWNIIHLFKEGGFYRAYNWSAWLIVAVAYNDEVRKNSSDRKPLNVSRKKTKNGENDFAFVGFPLKSLEKFIPNNTGFTPVNDTQIDISIELPATDTEISFEMLAQAFEEWKQTFPIADDKPKKDREYSYEGTPGPHSITAVMSQVLSFPLESKTPMEAMAFISTLKQQLAALI
jgi:hypothetical protein